MLPVQEIVISPDEGVIGTGLQFTFPKGMGQNQLGGIKAVVGVVERADVAIAFGLALCCPDSRHSAGAGWFAASFGRNVWCDRPILHLPGRYMPNGHCCDNRGYDETHRRHRGCVGG